MTTAFWKAAPLALLMSLPAGSPARAGDEPGDCKDKKIVADGECIVTLDDDGPPDGHVERSARRGYLGVHLIDITPDLRAHYGAPRDAGVLVAEIEADSPAARAGLQVGDVITRADADRIESAGELSRLVRRKKAGESVKIELERGKLSKTLTAILEERKAMDLDLVDLDLGDLKQHVHSLGPAMRDFHFKLPRIERTEALSRLQKKLDDLDKRLRDLEKRVR